MCGRYYTDERLFEEAQWGFDCVSNLSDANQPVRQGNLFSADLLPADSRPMDLRPADLCPVLKASSQGLRLVRMRWGYPGFGGNGLIINARAESVLEKRMFRHGILQNRIIVPARGFYEWNFHREKFTFARTGDDPLYMAGFADLWDQEERFVILTTQANPSVSPVHSRMPLILEPSQLSCWLEGGDAFQGLLAQVPAALQGRTEYEQQTLDFS